MHFGSRDEPDVGSRAWTRSNFCPECKSTGGIYSYSKEPVPVAGDFGPCRYCFNGLLYSDADGGLRLRRLSAVDVERLSHKVNPDIKEVFNLALVKGDPKENQKGLLPELLFKASELLPKNEFGNFLLGIANADAPFETTRGLLLILCSNAADEDKRKILLAFAGHGGRS